MKPILIIAAMPLETALLENALEQSERVSTAGFEYLTGKLGKLEIVVCAGGIGKINAAAATAMLIEKTLPRLVINTGCAGSYFGSGLSIGDLAVASEEVLVDEGVITTHGWRDLSYMKLPAFVHGGLQYYNTIPLSIPESEKAVQLAYVKEQSLKRGRFATVSTCSGTRQRGEELADCWCVIAENMEGAAVAQVCLRNRVDCLEVRGISNMVEERNMKKWELKSAVEAAQRFVLCYLEEMDKPPVSVHQI